MPQDTATPSNEIVEADYVEVVEAPVVKEQPGDDMKGEKAGTYRRSTERVNTTHSDDCLFLRAKVGDRFVEWLVDSGANPNLLSVKVFEQLPPAEKAGLRPVHTRLLAANGENIVTYGQAIVDVRLEGAIFSVPVIIADIGDMAGILGMKFLRETDCSIAFKAGLLRCGQQIWNLVGPRSADVFAVRLIRTVHIPPWHGIVVPGVVATVGNIPQKWEGVIEPEDNLTNQTSAAMPRSIVQICSKDDRHVAQLTLTNWTDEEVVLSSGTTVGRVEMLPEVQPSTQCSTVASGPKHADKLPEHLELLAASVSTELR